MPKVKLNRDRLEIAKELIDLASILEDERICLDAGPLKKASNQCRTEKPGGDNNAWGYEVESLLFRLASPRTIKPLNVADLTINFSITVAGKGIVDDNVDDPFTFLTADIIIQGIKKRSKFFYCCWHLDRHLSKPTDPIPEDVHPHYHFQYGGNKLTALTSNFGNTLFLEAPRLAHPPLDAILGIDFVISNFMGKKWHKMREVDQYVNLVKKAQERLWKPYIYNVQTAWAGLHDLKAWGQEHIWPQLVV